MKRLTVPEAQSMSDRMLAYVESHPGADGYKPVGCQHRHGHKTISASYRCLNSIGQRVHAVAGDGSKEG